MEAVTLHSSSETFTLGDASYVDVAASFKSVSAKFLAKCVI
jgi:hypothetical protein